MLESHTTSISEIVMTVSQTQVQFVKGPSDIGVGSGEPGGASFPQLGRVLERWTIGYVASP